jgi:DNA repair protein RecO (recombination protein O)
MPLRESEAVVLRSYPLGEADRLVSLLTRAEGRIRGVARGARRPKSRFGSTLETLSHIRVWFYERETRELVRINQCELIESFLDVQRDYERGLVLALLSEISEAVLPEREPSDAAFRLLLHTAEAVKQGADPALCVTYFALWTVRLAGWLPDLSRCGRCGREMGSEAAFAGAGYSALACSRCRAPGMMSLSARSLAAARKMLEQRLDRLVSDKEAAPRGLAAEDLQDYLMDTIESQIERKLSTRRMLAMASRGAGKGLREPQE